MRQLTRSALLAQPAARLFSIIADVERYPEFVPGCKAARIEARAPHEVVATLEVQRGALHTQFTTRNHLEPERRVLMKLERGPFRHLEGEWLLTPIAQQGTRVDLTMRFAFASALSALLFERLFAQTVSDLMDAFVARARSDAA
jgi:ribosome-associated toxin RatA of RatAB toxin-antitoxin module